jgi:DNA repair protein RecN (Recombination protein N)
MLSELSIRDFAIIDRLELKIHPGFNVLTGETGAGKSIVIDAVGLLLGERADAGLVRAGAEAARVEGVFALGAGARARSTRCSRASRSRRRPRARCCSREIRREGRDLPRQRACRHAGAAQGDRPELIDVHGQSDTSRCCA